MWGENPLVWCIWEPRNEDIDLNHLSHKWFQKNDQAPVYQHCRLGLSRKCSFSHFRQSFRENHVQIFAKIASQKLMRKSWSQLVRKWTIVDFSLSSLQKRQNLWATCERKGVILEKYLDDMRFWQVRAKVFVFWKHFSCRERFRENWHFREKIGASKCGRMKYKLFLLNLNYFRENRQS